ncbi:septum site-determining protein MinC [Peribacillus tepidiphilus]|jgi:septum site-determining protein MinC|uniref:septum site-determining protein MinC n=1 Tax=Peribacillus tepidiphilus TaxID=2652445 RepID=UPI0035B4FBD2
MNKLNSQNVTIKGTKEGLTLHLDDSCSFYEIKRELEEKLSAKYKFQQNDPIISVKVHTGKRLFSEEQKQEIKQLVEKKEKLVIDSFQSNVVAIEEATKWKEENETHTLATIVRSGQIVEVKGDLVLIGDVNPGGTVKATGNIFIVGMLKGAAHAGSDGNEQAVIVSSRMCASQLRIADFVTLIHDQSEKELRDMECAYINNEREMVVDKLQVLRNIRPNFNRLEGGV